MRVLLVKPQPRLRTIIGLHRLQRLEPLELGYLAAVVKAPHQVQVLDLRLARRPLRTFTKVLERYRPDLVGFTAYSHEASMVKALAATVKGCLPGSTVVVGGPHATVAPEDLASGDIDAVVRGEGCQPLTEIINRLMAGDELQGIDRVLLPGVDELSAARGLEQLQYPDPAGLPIPRRDLWDPRRYHSVWIGEQLPSWHALLPQVSMVRSSWGCRMRCSFCIVPWLYGRHWPRPVSAVADEISALPSEHVYFSDDENFIDQDFAAELATELARRRISKRYFAWARATTVNGAPELFRLWREVGLDAVFIGFEFPTDQELKQVTKGSTVAANERALDTLRSIGIAVHAGFMVRPEYGEEEFATLRRYVDGMPPSLTSFTVCTPSPGTPDYQAMAPQIWVDNPYDLYDCMHPLVKTTLPLRRFSHLLAAQAAAGTTKVPQRAKSQPVPIPDMVRILGAEWRYRRGLRHVYRDYPRQLWG